MLALPADPTKRTAPTKRRAVVALGGNTFQSPGHRLTMDGQLRFAHRAMTFLGCLLREHGPLLVSHGNGPQVGYILARVEAALEQAYRIPLEVCVAESEGELGYVLQQAIHNVLADLGESRPVASLLTLVEVDAEDRAFARPDKPVGPFHTREQAERLWARGFVVVQDAGRGYRRVVPSPAPLRILDLDLLRKLFDDGVLVVAAGGGGIPVVRQANHFRGVEAVVDKDRTSALLADRLDADLLVILTAVPCVYRDFGSPRQQPLADVSPAELQHLLDEGQFAAGSMGPKIEAALQFADRPGRQVLITDPASLEAALQGQAGTRIRVGEVPEMKE
jgi:carbamate kinase